MPESEFLAQYAKLPIDERTKGISHLGTSFDTIRDVMSRLRGLNSEKEQLLHLAKRYFDSRK